MRSLMFLIFLGALLPACATVGVWDEGFPKDGLGMTDAEKRAEFNRFAIQDFGARGGRDWVEVGKNAKGDPRRVTLSSFYPVLEDVSPATKAQLDEIAKLHENDKYAEVASGVGIAAAVLGPTAAIRNLGALGMIGGIGGGAVLKGLRREQLEEIQQRYNADLTRRLYGARSPEAAQAAASL